MTDVSDYTPTAEELADIIDRAADELFINGHKKNSYGMVSGPKCSLGVLTCVVTGRESACDEYADVYPEHDFDIEDSKFANRRELWYTLIGHVARELPETAEVPGNVNRISAWNDHVDRTPAEVIDHFRSVAKDLRNGEDRCVS